jgi:hypothetical protein
MNLPVFGSGLAITHYVLRSPSLSFDAVVKDSLILNVSFNLILPHFVRNFTHYYKEKDKGMLPKAGERQRAIPLGRDKSGNRERNSS